MKDNTTQQSSENLAETLAREMKKPEVLDSASSAFATRTILLPPGWTSEYQDDEGDLPAPRRKTATVRLDDVNSFIDYVKRHGSLARASIWCEANYAKGSVELIAILNDHGEEESEPAWRDHKAFFRPALSEEWNRWIGGNKKQFSQAEFAAFIEDNMGDVAGADGSATGAQMLDMALQFEANQDMRFKSAIRLQNGGVQMSFVHDDDDATLAKMQMFDRFNLGIPVFWNDAAYKIDVRLRYRVREGKLTFWYELLRHDKALEAATKEMLDSIRKQTGTTFFFGKPFVS
ncbi:MAG: YfdQ family protein [Burkholderiales bacterium]|jgi:uncharacterized protein YfdQ (DUF2303 family)|nr:YfdQ family protein [Burkholderiales bacterium]